MKPVVKTIHGWLSASVSGNTFLMPARISDSPNVIDSILNLRHCLGYANDICLTHATKVKITLEYTPVRAARWYWVKHKYHTTQPPDDRLDWEIKYWNGAFWSDVITTADAEGYVHIHDDNFAKIDEDTEIPMWRDI